MNIGIEADEFDMGFETTEPEVEERTVIETLRVSDFFSMFKSGVGLDISKNHTGICIWRNNKVECYGFAVDMEYDKNSYLAEAKMRLEFKQKLYDILKDFEWEVCIIEDVYGGTNFDTTRKLLALNCVLDELVLEDKLKVSNIYRLKEAEWLKGMREISDAGRRLNPKYQCQKILEMLEFDFYMQHKDDTDAKKREIFFEDICDATGQLLGLVMKLRRAEANVKGSSIRLTGMYLDFIDDEEDIHWSDNPVIREAPIVWKKVEGFPDIEKVLVGLIAEDDESVYVLPLTTQQLGTFGIRNGFNFYEQGYGYLICYAKKLNKVYR